MAGRGKPSSPGKGKRPKDEPGILAESMYRGDLFHPEIENLDNQPTRDTLVQTKFKSRFIVTGRTDAYLELGLPLGALFYWKPRFGKLGVAPQQFEGLACHRVTSEQLKTSLKTCDAAKWLRKVAVLDVVWASFYMSELVFQPNLRADELFYSWHFSEIGQTGAQLERVEGLAMVCLFDKMRAQPAVRGGDDDSDQTMVCAILRTYSVAQGQDLGPFGCWQSQLDESMVGARLTHGMFVLATFAVRRQTIGVRGLHERIRAVDSLMSVRLVPDGSLGRFWAADASVMDLGRERAAFQARHRVDMLSLISSLDSLESRIAATHNRLSVRCTWRMTEYPIVVQVQLPNVPTADMRQFSVYNRKRVRTAQAFVQLPGDLITVCVPSDRQLEHAIGYLHTHASLDAYVPTDAQYRNRMTGVVSNAVTSRENACTTLTIEFAPKYYEHIVAIPLHAREFVAIEEYHQRDQDAFVQRILSQFLRLCDPPKSSSLATSAAAAEEESVGVPVLANADAFLADVSPAASDASSSTTRPRALGRGLRLSAVDATDGSLGVSGGVCRGSSPCPGAASTRGPRLVTSSATEPLGVARGSAIPIREPRPGVTSAVESLGVGRGSPSHTSASGVSRVGRASVAASSSRPFGGGGGPLGSFGRIQRQLAPAQERPDNEDDYSTAVEGDGPEMPYRRALLQRKAHLGRAFVGVECARFDNPNATAIESPGFCRTIQDGMLIRATERQRDVGNIVLGKRATITAILGPPGTGKTNTLVGMVVEAFVGDCLPVWKDEVVLISAPTNDAVDSIAFKLDEQFQQRGENVAKDTSEVRMLRLYATMLDRKLVADSDKKRPRCDLDKLSLSAIARLAPEGCLQLGFWTDADQLLIETTKREEWPDHIQQDTTKFKYSYSRSKSELDTSEHEMRRYCATNGDFTTTCWKDLVKKVKVLRRRLRRALIKMFHPNIILTTSLAAAQHEVQIMRPTVLILDEAAYASPVAAFSMLFSSSDKAKQFILAGDMHQMSPHTRLSGWPGELWRQSNFELLYETCAVHSRGGSTAMTPYVQSVALNVSFRMSTETVDYLAMHHYEGVGLTGATQLSDRPPPRIIREATFFPVNSNCGSGPAYTLVDNITLGRQERALGTSWANTREIGAALVYHASFLSRLCDGDVFEPVYLCYYRGQRELLRRAFQYAGFGAHGDAMICTGDSFQGREGDLVFVLTTRAAVDDELTRVGELVRTNGVGVEAAVAFIGGFLIDPHRHVTFISRHRFALVVLCHLKTLTLVPVWSTFLGYARQNNYIKDDHYEYIKNWLPTALRRRVDGAELRLRASKYTSSAVLLRELEHSDRVPVRAAISLAAEVVSSLVLTAKPAKAGRDDGVDDATRALRRRARGLDADDDVYPSSEDGDADGDDSVSRHSDDDYLDAAVTDTAVAVADMGVAAADTAAITGVVAATSVKTSVSVQLESLPPVDAVVHDPRELWLVRNASRRELTFVNGQTFGRLTASSLQRGTRPYDYYYFWRGLVARHGITDDDVNSWMLEKCEADRLADIQAMRGGGALDRLNAEELFVRDPE